METFNSTDGRVLARAGDRPFEGEPGDIAIAPVGIPHGFINLGPGNARLVCVNSWPAVHTEFLAQARAT